jgi:DNA polymerase-3 subunit gamma/tau
MSYQVLARKWRPNKFSELVGQEHVVTAISHALDNGRLHHAYLFTGTRGVGKTTIARIFSKSLNCDTGQSAEPCGVCDTCKSIEEGSFVDLLEIDAASRTKVEDTRELLDNVQYKPTRGRYKVYLIDEVHMLSKHSFNALLKTLEEPPPHVKFLLATTDPQKLPVTILSRCLQFNLKALSREQIASQLEHILEQETIPFEGKALGLLARAAQGSMRDALSLTDQAIAQGNNTVKQSIVTDMLGLMDKQLLLKLLHAVVDKEKLSILDLVEQLSSQAPDYGQVLAELSSLLHQIALTQWEPEACKLETSSARAIFAMAKRLSGEHVQLLYKLTLEGIKELPHSVDGKTCLEMTLLRMTSFAPIYHSASSSEERRSIIQETSVEQKPPEPPSLNSESNSESSHEAEHANEALLNEATSEEHDILASNLGDTDDLSSMDREQQQLENQALKAPEVNDSDDVAMSNIEKTQALLALRQSLNQPESQQTQKKTTNKPSSEPRIFEERKAITKSSVESTTKSAQQNPEPAVFDHANDSEPPPWVLDFPNDIGESTANKDESLRDSVLQPRNESDVPIAIDNEPAPNDKDSVELAPFLKNGEKLVHAKQVNSWSKLIEQSTLNGLDKQIVLNASFTQTDSTVTLLVDKSQQHLISDAATAHITEAIQNTLGADKNVHIEMGDPKGTPTHIQREIEQIRQQHAEQTVATDTHIQSLVKSLDANIDHESIKAR